MGTFANAAEKKDADTRFAEATRCVAPAAEYHGVNPDIVRAIIKVESSGNPNAINKNQNGTIDIGIGQFNSGNMNKLTPFGITQKDLYDPCVGIYITAWHLSKMLERHGNTWFGIAAYHSATPYFNNRYQVLIQNALISMGAMEGAKKPVPPLNRSSPGEVRVASNSKARLSPQVEAAIIAISNE